jgi:hypothetical protein
MRHPSCGQRKCWNLMITMCTASFRLWTQLVNSRKLSVAGEISQIFCSPVFYGVPYPTVFYLYPNYPINQLTKLQQQCPSWEAYSHSTSQKIRRILQNPKVHRRVDNSPTRVLIVTQINTAQPPYYFFTTRCNINLAYTPRSFKWSVSFRLPHQNFVRTSRT